MRLSLLAFAATLLVPACGARSELDLSGPRDPAQTDAFEPPNDGGGDVFLFPSFDAGFTEGDVGVALEAAVDGRQDDAGTADVGPGDASPFETGAGDTGATDTGPIDAGPFDTGPFDTGTGDGGDASCSVGQPTDFANWHPSNSPRNLVDNGDGTITDDDTGLTWMQRAAGESAEGGVEIYTMSFAEAEAACPCPWRLPQRSELLSIVDYTRYDMAVNPLFLAPAADTNIAWTATPYEGSSSKWLVSLINGEPEGARADPFAQVRCVRGSTQAPAARYALQTGDAGTPEIVDYGTGLAWKELSEPGTYDWATANSQCASPYRLPTISELQTLVDSSASNPAIDTGFFADTGADLYISATLLGYVYLDGYFWYVDFTDGSANYASSFSAGSPYQVRCVR